jgi:hypothetical protein
MVQSAVPEGGEAGRRRGPHRRELGEAMPRADGRSPKHFPGAICPTMTWARYGCAEEVLEAAMKSVPALPARRQARGAAAGDAQESGRAPPAADAARPSSSAAEPDPSAPTCSNAHSRCTRGSSECAGGGWGVLAVQRLQASATGKRAAPEPRSSPPSAAAGAVIDTTAEPAAAWVAAGGSAAASWAAVRGPPTSSRAEQRPRAQLHPGHLQPPALLQRQRPMQQLQLQWPLPLPLRRQRAQLLLWPARRSRSPGAPLRPHLDPLLLPPAPSALLPVAQPG